uniref:Peptidase S1 domain-containing protein n=1 Tax=Anopheles atroparvus TaxID=41427 RepID=A0AAG5D340_ANOAO
MKLVLLVTLTTIAFVHTRRVRIIDGTFAELHEFPYQVSLQWNFNNGSRARHICSGSILNRNWILTAAHCKQTLSRDGWIEVVAGVNNVVNEEASAQRRNVSRFIQHEEYNASNFRNDIGVILLSKPLELRREISTITLALQNAVINQTEGKFAGWGSISKTFIDIFPDELRKVTLPLRTLEDCQVLGSEDRSQVCGGGYRNVSGCIADSGGPLTVVQDNGARVQIGVLSYGETPCKARLPNVFSSVMYFHDWIQKTIKRRQFKWFP